MQYEAYQSWGQKQANDRIEAHLPLVYSLATHFAGRAGQAGIEMGDLIHTGVLGLYAALESFDEARGSTFGSYAKPYVRGAMLDEVFKQLNETRAVRDKYRKIRDAEDTLVREMMREPTDKELADAMHVDVKTLSMWLADIGMREHTSLDVLVDTGIFHEQDDTISRQPELYFLERESKTQLVSALSALSLREQQLLHLYYQEELTLKEIGYVLELSESQVSRTHKKILATLQTLMRDAE